MKHLETIRGTPPFRAFRRTVLWTVFLLKQARERVRKLQPRTIFLGIASGLVLAMIYGAIDGRNAEAFVRRHCGIDLQGKLESHMGGTDLFCGSDEYAAFRCVLTPEAVADIVVQACDRGWEPFTAYRAPFPWGYDEVLAIPTPRPTGEIMWSFQFGEGMVYGRALLIPDRRLLLIERCRI